MTCDEPTCWTPSLFPRTTCLNLPLSDKAQSYLTKHSTSPTRQAHLLSPVSPFAAHPVLLPAQCPVLLRSPEVAQQQFKLPSTYWCFAAATVPGARDKIWKIRVLNVREKMESVELKGTSRILCSSSSFSKEKIGPWRLNDPLQATAQQYLQCTSLLIMIKNNPPLCLQLSKAVCHPICYLSY